MSNNNQLPNINSDDIYNHIMSSSDNDAEENFISKEKNKKRKNIALVSILSLAIIGGAGSALYFANPFKDDKQQVGNAQPGNAQTDNNSDTNNAGVIKQQAKFWQVDGKNNYPVDLKNWQMLSHNSMNKTNINELINKYANTSLAISSHRLPSEESGFTSDKNKIKLSNGTLNPMYTTITSEDYQRIVESDIERLINPMYGDWEQYQHPNGHASKTFETSRFADIFSTNWLEKNKNKNPATYFPVYADWQENDYNMKNKLLGENDPRWMGTIDSMTSKFTYNDKTQQYTSDVNVKVKYSAWAQDQSTLTKNGTLTLKIITNTSDTNKQKLLIDDAKLTMDKE